MKTSRTSPPLNTPAGQAQIEREIAQMDGADLAIFDNVMSLIPGDQKDEEGWRQILPWVRSLTKRSIGQIWLHHTGHDGAHSYGTKTREWQMDTVIRLELSDEDQSDGLSFKLSFDKARERTPETRADFIPVTVALVDDAWTCDAAVATKTKVSPLGVKFLDALRDAAIGNEANKMHGCPAASLDSVARRVRAPRPHRRRQRSQRTHAIRQAQARTHRRRPNRL